MDKHNHSTWSKIFSDILTEYAKKKPEEQYHYLIEQAELYGIRESLISFIIMGVQPSLINNSLYRERTNNQIGHSTLIYYIERYYDNDILLRFMRDDLLNEMWLLNELSNLMFKAPGYYSGKIISIEEKINWKAGPDKLKEHLEILRTEGFISYDKQNIDDIMSGEKKAELIKHRNYKAINQNILAIFELWNEKKYISGYIDKEGKRQYKEFIWNLFTWKDAKGVYKPFNPESMKGIQSRDNKKIEEVKNYLKKILTT